MPTTGSSTQSFISIKLLMLVLLCIGSWGVRVASAQLTPPGPYRISSASGLSGEDEFYFSCAAAIDQYVIFGTSTGPGKAVVFELSGGTITRVGSASGSSEEYEFYCAVAIGQYVIFGTNRQTSPAIFLLQ